MKYKYAVILEPEEEEGYDGINVTVPDIFGGVTCGDDEEDAIFMAKDMIEMMLKEAPAQCRPPKSLEETQKNFPDKKVVLVEVEI